MSCGCEDKPWRNYYRYYDTPDGCDLAKKILVTSRYGTIAGMIFATYDVLLFSHAIGIVPVLKRYAMHVVPLALMGATFTVVSHAALQARQRDDQYNYFLGGFACGPILASYLRSKHAILLGGLALGTAGMIKKVAVTNGYTIFPTIQSHFGSITAWRHNYTLTNDPLDELRHSCGTKQKKCN
ncbi:PREDICTED: NADH dehydrogenase [ubiquinone] 1 alpha subcomplex subunit 11-like [Papilio polytes]|uniref:NADH dehydrogenase [ubiquinone] 1 alpha subcomplex subunit 11-like n=1 Tax=Papilio polytes TaxID=76194 RepID=UPI000675F724|nr:PREDICTED: NADH dehydrogenase [ubiquinone] 1 alpha subcomplex subunit 11-like [Papilio polytes]